MKGTKMQFFGAFKTKARAKMAERAHGAFIIVRKIRNSKRFIVLKKSK